MTNPSAMLPPGLMAIHGNHPEALRDVLVAWMRRHPLAPLERETMLVQSNGIAQWMKLALARDAGEGGCGIAAALDLQLPGRFVWQAYRAVLGADLPQDLPFDRPLLVWRLMRLLPELLADEACDLGLTPLARFLDADADLRRRYQLAGRLADLYDQYQVYRADWLADWADGRDTIRTSRRGVEPLPEAQRWQACLWRALLADVGPEAARNGRAEVHRRFMEAVRALPDAPRPAGVPRRLAVFGVSAMPQQTLEVLAALARWTQVLLCVHNPCEHYWANIVADKDLLRAERSRQLRKSGSPDLIAEEQLHLHAHPLLAAWGRQGRDFIGLLDAYDERERYEHRFLEVQQRIDLFQANGDDCLLHQLQDDIRELRPLAETRARWPAVDPRSDASIRFHIAHSPQREVEVLHDQLLEAFAADPTLRPRDIIVMVPDIHAYAPHVQAVFGLPEPDDLRHIPYAVSDRGPRRSDPLLGALEKLLGLPQSRVAVSDLLDWLEVPAIRRRFAIDEAQLPLLHRWVRAANVRWGLHAEQRRSLGLAQAPEQNTWSFGLRRMLLGYAVGGAGAWEGIEPLDEIGGLDAALLGPLARLLDTLQSAWRGLREPAAPDAWCARLRALMADFFDPGEGADGLTLRRLDDALQQWQDACAAARLAEALPLSVVRDQWLARIDQPALSQPFFAGAVTFATLMPMRAIPFRRVCLLGMNDGDFPRPQVPADFDLMGHDYRPGDRSRREDDRYLFLEALLSAREHLHIGWVGRSVHDNGERPPSVLVAQLRDHLAAGWRLQDAPTEGPGAVAAGRDLLAALTVAHRLQPFSRDYFRAGGPLFSYAREWRDGLAAPDPDPSAAAGPGAAQRLDAVEADEPLTLRRLSDFLKDPVRAFFLHRLGVAFENADPAAQDHEPFAIDALENWRLQDELVQAQKAALAQGGDRETVLRDRLGRIGRRGELPWGAFSEVLAGELAEPMAEMFERHAEALARWPEPLPDEPLDPADARGEPTVRVEDWLDGLRQDADGARCRLVLESVSLLKDRSYRRDRLIPFWIAHLAGHLGGAPMESAIVGKNGTVRLAPLDPERARAHWEDLLDAWREGMRRPLPVAVRSGFAWLSRAGDGGEAGGAGRGSGPGGRARLLRAARTAEPAACGARRQPLPRPGLAGFRRPVVRRRVRAVGRPPAAPAARGGRPRPGAEQGGDGMNRDLPPGAQPAAADAPAVLSPLDFPLRGSRLIEASAGTGKTFTIAALYVRLVLGHGGEAAFARPLMPPEILVVTFTDAATKELRDRIRARLAEAAAAFLADPAAPESDAAADDFLRELRAGYPADAWPSCARKLQLAAEWMDESAVSTIHGWCNRMLGEHAFDSNCLFDQTLEADQGELLAESVRDYWRTFYYPLAAADIRALRGWWASPGDLHAALRPLLPHAGTLPDAPEPRLAIGGGARGGGPAARRAQGALARLGRRAGGAAGRGGRGQAGPRRQAAASPLPALDPGPARLGRRAGGARPGPEGRVGAPVARGAGRRLEGRRAAGASGAPGAGGAARTTRPAARRPVRPAAPCRALGLRPLRGRAGAPRPDGLRRPARTHGGPRCAARRAKAWRRSSGRSSRWR
ncbi:MAG: exodeoxyribonuclease V subunit gamma [Xylophilus ampelinus]